MHNNTEEYYVFLRMASGDIQQAKRTIEVAVDQRDLEIKYAMVRDALVAYARPFKTCRGKFGKYSLDSNSLSIKKVDVHNAIIQWRDQIVAHSDIDIRDPKLHKWSSSTGNVFPIAFKGFYAGDMPKEQDIIDLCEELEMLVLQKINEMQRSF